MIPPSNWLELEAIKSCKLKLKSWTNKDFTNKAQELYGSSSLTKVQIVDFISKLKQGTLSKAPESPVKVPVFTWRTSGYSGLEQSPSSLLEDCYNNSPTCYGKIKRTKIISELKRLPDNSSDYKRYWGIQVGDTANSRTLKVTKVTPKLDGPPEVHYEPI